MITFVRRSNQIVLSNIMGKLQPYIYYRLSIYPSRLLNALPHPNPLDHLKGDFKKNYNPKY